MKIYPGVHYFMGGIHTDWNHMTAIPGLFASGECDYMYHGANRLGANSLLSALYSGTISGPAAADYALGVNRLAEEENKKLFASYRNEEIAYDERIKSMGGRKTHINYIRKWVS